MFLSCAFHSIRQPFCYRGVFLGEQMSMETTDTPRLLDADPLQPRALEHLTDWEITELILRLEAEQRRREQARWEEA